MSKQLSIETKPQEVAISKNKQAVINFETHLSNYEKKELTS